MSNITDTQRRIDDASRKQFGTAAVTGLDGDRVNLRRTGELAPDGQAHPQVQSYGGKAAGGQATIPDGSLSVTVAHGLDYTPAPEDIMARLCNLPTVDTGNILVENVTETSFDIRVRTDPTTSGALFDWAVADRKPQDGDEIQLDRRGNSSMTVHGRIVR